MLWMVFWHGVFSTGIPSSSGSGTGVTVLGNKPGIPSILGQYGKGFVF